MKGLRLFEKRFLFEGKLVLNTALHLGGGRLALVSTDDPLVRTPDGDPFIPGSSLKGVFRSTVEKIGGALPGVKTCLLDPNNNYGCIGPQGDAQRAYNKERQKTDWNKKEYCNQLNQKLCDTCKLFGSPYKASKINFDDLYLVDRDTAFTQVRDGVGIDRDSEKAVDRVKFDYEVVASGAEFEMKIILDNPTEMDLALISIGLSEFQNSFVRLGGKTSSGLGSCKLEELDIYFLDLLVPEVKDKDQKVKVMSERLKKYLVGSAPEDKMEHVSDVSAFLRDKIEFLFREGSPNAQATC